jgi:hypothetical protein
MLGLPAVALAPLAPAPTALEPLAAAELAPALGTLLTAEPPVPEAGAWVAPVPELPMAPPCVGEPLVSEEQAALSATNNNTQGFEVNVRQLVICTVIVTPSEIRS